MESTSDARIWLTRFVDQVAERIGYRPILSGILTLGAVPLGLTVVFLALVGEPVPPRFLVAHLLATLVPVFGVPAIWYWNARVYPRFVERTATLAADADAVRSDAAAYLRTFARSYRPFTILWTLLITTIIGLNLPFFRWIGVTGRTDPAYLVYLLFAVWWGVITGIGFHGAITAIRAIRAVGDHDLKIDPLTPTVSVVSRTSGRWPSGRRC